VAKSIPNVSFSCLLQVCYQDVTFNRPFNNGYIIYTVYALRYLWHKLIKNVNSLFLKLTCPYAKARIHTW